MRHLTIDVSNYDARLHIGKQGENLTREITFDCAAWLDDLSGGVLSIVHQRPTDPDAYPCGDYVTTDTSLTWSINETDVAFSGLGKCELRYTIGSRIAKTKTFYTEIVNALNPLDTPPAAYEPYIDRVIDAARQEMENMTVSASATEGEEASASVTKETTDHVNLDFEFVLQKGEAGDNGMSVREVTATYTEDGGEPAVDVFTEEPYPQPDHPYQDLQFRFKNLKGDKGDTGTFDTSYLPSDTATGNPATFPDGAKNVAVDELIMEILPQQAGSGTPSPTNPRAMSERIQAQLTHNGISETIAFGQSIVGGTLNVTTGILKINRVIVGGSDWSQYAQGGGYKGYRLLNCPKSVTTTTATFSLSKPISNMVSEFGSFSSSSMIKNIIQIPYATLTTAYMALDENYSGKDVYLSYLIPDESSTLIQLTPTEVETILGANSFSSDCGEVSVKYRADIGLYIDKKLS